MQEETLPNSFSGGSSTLIPQPDTVSKKKIIIIMKDKKKRQKGKCIILRTLNLSTQGL